LVNIFKIPVTVSQVFSNKYLSASESIFTSLVRKWKKLYSMAFSMQKRESGGRKKRRKEGRQKERKEGTRKYRRERQGKSYNKSIT